MNHRQTQRVGWVERSDTHQLHLMETQAQPIRTTHGDRTRRSDRCLCVRRCRSRALRVFEVMKSISAECKWKSIADESRAFTQKQPVGQISVQPRCEKYFCFRAPQITSRTFRIPPHNRGVSRSSRTRGGGRWTRQRQARNVMAGRVGERPVSDQTAR